VIYRLNFYRDDKLTGTELVDVRVVQEANELARRAVKTGRAVRAEVRYTSGGIAFGAGPKRSSQSV
jgi:hypothetical protein